jgi:hypothetical protein
MVGARFLASGFPWAEGIAHQLGHLGFTLLLVSIAIPPVKGVGADLVVERGHLGGAPELGSFWQRQT